MSETEPCKNCVYYDEDIKTCDLHKKVNITLECSSFLDIFKIDGYFKTEEPEHF